MESRRAASSAQREVWGSVAVAAPYGWAASSSAPRPARSSGQQRAADRSSVLHVHSAEGVKLGCFGRPARQEWGRLERRWPCYPRRKQRELQPVAEHPHGGWVARCKGVAGSTGQTVACRVIQHAPSCPRGSGKAGHLADPAFPAVASRGAAAAPQSRPSAPHLQSRATPGP